VHELERICFPEDAWPLLDVIGVLTLPSVVRLKALNGEQLIGFIAVDIRRRQNEAWIATIGVHPDHRRRGVGRRLLAAGEAQLETAKVKLTVRASNQAAIALYERFGYHQVQVWRRYYEGGEDGVVMEKTLAGRA